MTNYIDNMKVKIPTELEFYNDTFKKTCECFVDDVYESERYGKYFALSKTIFYPHGGGQKGDRGVLKIPEGISNKLNIDGEIKITDTRKEGDYIVHVLDPEFVMPDYEELEKYLIGEAVSIELDWEFRHKQMRLHSIAHLLHFFTEKVANKKLPYPETSDLQDGYGINKYGKPNIIPKESAKEVENLLKEFNGQSHTITTYPDEKKKGYRYWECSEYVVPCGGSHLLNTDQIGDFEVAISSRKGKTTLKFELK